MKTSFSYRSLESQKRGRNRLVFVTILVISIIGVDMIMRGAIRNTVHAGVAMVSGWVAGAGNIILGSGVFSSQRTLQSQNSLLLERLGQLEERAAAYEALKVENDELRALLHVTGDAADPNEKRGVTAPVVSSVRSSPYGTFLIGAGSADGIVSGSLVLTSGGFVVGIVGNSGLHTTIVTEVFAPGVSTEGSVNGIPIIAHGSGGGNARIQVPRGLAVAIGDIVLAPALGQRPIGIVGSISSSSASASEELHIRLPMNLASLSYVYVIPPRN